MAEKKITQAEIFADIREIVGAAGRDDLVEFCDTKILQLENKAIKAKEKAAEKKVESDGLTDAILATLTGELQTPDAIADAIEGFEDVTRAKVIARMKGLIEAGKAVKEQNADKKMCYKLA